MLNMEHPPVRRSPMYHVYTIWLFTRSDMKTIVGPSTLFAVVCTLSGFGTNTGAIPSALFALRRLPVAAFWVWMNLLPFSIENQRQDDSIVEDAQNKPWRPMPSKRLTRPRAVQLMLIFYLFAMLSSVVLGGFFQCIALVGLGYWYNDLRGADCSCIIRNFINGCGYICFTSGALEVLSDRSVFHMDPVAYWWIVIIGIVILTTVQAQDMPDQVGDSLRKRWTVPLVIGDWAARVTIAVPVAIWSYVCPAYWQLGIRGLAMTVTLGSVVIRRFLLRRTVEADRMTFRIYNMWIVSLYLLPLVKRCEGMHNSVMLWG